MSLRGEIFNIYTVEMQQGLFLQLPHTFIVVR